MSEAACSIAPPQNREGLTSLLLNNVKGEEWDLVFCNGILMTVSGRYYISQKVKQLLLTNQQEFFRDIEYGIQWFNEILGAKNPDISTVKSLIESFLQSNTTLQELGVTSIIVDNVTIDNKNRAMTINITIEADGSQEPLEVTI